MLQHPRIHTLLKSVVSLVILAGFGFLYLAELQAEMVLKPSAEPDQCSCQNCGEEKYPPEVVDVLKAIVESHKEIVTNKDGKYSKDEDLAKRINSLNIISLVASKKEYLSAYKQREELFKQLQARLEDPDEKSEIKEQIAAQLPLILTHPLHKTEDKNTTVEVMVTVEGELTGELKGKLKGKLEGEVKSELKGELNGNRKDGLKGKLEIPQVGSGKIEGTVTPPAVVNQEDYQDLVDLMDKYLNASPISFEKSWQVTSGLRSGLLALPEDKSTDLTSHQKCGYCNLTCALNKVALNCQLDIQVRFNAMNALVEKGDQFRVEIDKEHPEKPRGFDSNNDPKRFYIIIQRLNELLTHENAGCLPASVREKANYDLIRFMGYKL
ncbi:hypothetical protein Pan153_39850 [Gimesia panareensis]|uniref:Uncharacterized protein n=1 Tax=Gimesia panareensis TaxID=2527978 RepID=A0A518FSM9_9PLAN|nr:hypothetical protein [Gimesia panareensis]QDV19320.1 hypothetical protein Pan153_39850 [Gimesia panareensis]